MKILVYRVPYSAMSEGVVEEFEAGEDVKTLFHNYLTENKLYASTEDIKVNATATHIVYFLEAKLQSSRPNMIGLRGL